MSPACAHWQLRVAPFLPQLCRPACIVNAQTVPLNLRLLRATISLAVAWVPRASHGAGGPVFGCPPPAVACAGL
jgi:hypothetical protein